jgi:hypothetical protein
VELPQGTARVSCVSYAHMGCAAAKGRRETKSHGVSQQALIYHVRNKEGLL